MSVKLRIIRSFLKTDINSDQSLLQISQSLKNWLKEIPDKMQCIYAKFLLCHWFQVTGSRGSSPIVKMICASIWCKFPPGVFWWSNPSNVCTDLFSATKKTVQLCVIAEEGFVWFVVTIEDDEAKLGEGPILGTLRGW